MTAELGSVQVTPANGAMDISGLYVATGSATYNPAGRSYRGVVRPGMSDIKFWLKSGMPAGVGGGYFATAEFTVYGTFDDPDDAHETPRMTDCYLYCLRSSGLSDEVRLAIEAHPWEEPGGTAADPTIRFFCTFEIAVKFDKLISDNDPTDCHGTLLLEVNRYGVTSYLNHTITYGQADVKASPGGSFLLEHTADEITGGWLGLPGGI